MTTPPPLYTCLPERGADPDAILAGFLRYAAELGLSLYAHQEEALLALMQGHDVIVNTPTGCSALKSLVKDSLQSDAQKRRHKEHAIVLLRPLWQAGVVDLRAASAGGGVHVSAELQADFSLFHTLGLYLVDAVERLPRESPTYALDVLTLVEATVEDPDVILRAQVDEQRTGQRSAMAPSLTAQRYGPSAAASTGPPPVPLEPPAPLASTARPASAASGTQTALRMAIMAETN